MNHMPTILGCLQVRLEQEKPFDYMNCSYMQMEAS
jgi:hypothetical protein